MRASGTKEKVHVDDLKVYLPRMRPPVPREIVMEMEMGGWAQRQRRDVGT